MHRYACDYTQHEYSQREWAMGTSQNKKTREALHMHISHYKTKRLMHLSRDCRLLHAEGMLAARVGNGGHLATRGLLRHSQAILRIKKFNEDGIHRSQKRRLLTAALVFLRALKQHVALLSTRN